MSTPKLPRSGSLAARVLYISLFAPGVTASDVGLRGQRDTFLTVIHDLSGAGFMLTASGARYRYLPMATTEAVLDSDEGRVWLAQARTIARGASVQRQEA